MSRRQVATALLAVLALYELAAQIVNGFSPGPGGETSSAYATAPAGLAAYHDLLGRTGHRAVELRGATAGTRLSAGETVVMLDPGILTRSDLAHVAAFVRAGGTLVAGGEQPGRWLAALDPQPPAWSPAGDGVATDVVPSAQTAGVAAVRGAGAGAFTDAGDTQTLIAGASGALLVQLQLGRGRIDLLADASPLQNGYLDRADNAALGEALAGPPGTPVAFLEGIHGYGNATGLVALPTRWKWVLVLLMLSAAVAVASRFRRIGDPEPQPELPLPPRRAHVDAVGLALQRTGQPAAAIAPVRTHARDLVLRRAALERDASGAAVRDAAAGMGLEKGEAALVAGLDTPRDDAGALAVGRALAKLSGGGP